MVISSDSQLGLRWRNENVKVPFLELMLKYNKNLQEAYEFAASLTQKQIDSIESGIIPDDYNYKRVDEVTLDNGFTVDLNENSGVTEVGQRITQKIGLNINIVGDDHQSSYYLITQGVLKPAEMIKIGDGFTGRILKGLKQGKYTYLLGKHKMIRFVVYNDVVKGLYYDDKDQIAFEYGLETDSGEYYCDKKFSKEFSIIMQIITFVALGDIEVVMLHTNQNNGKPKKDGKITNSSHYSVYVVDSTWNKILIRTDGFAVRGHFRLQACGEGLKDRKLMWINAYEKDGYTRRPKAEIVN